MKGVRSLLPMGHLATTHGTCFALSIRDCLIPQPSFSFAHDTDVAVLFVVVFAPGKRTSRGNQLGGIYLHREA